jgi:hypothetical protein
VRAVGAVAFRISVGRTAKGVWRERLIWSVVRGELILLILVIVLDCDLAMTHCPTSIYQCLLGRLCKIQTNWMRLSAGLVTQHVSGTSMPIVRSTIVSSAFWCPNPESRLDCVALGCYMCVLLRGCGPHPLSSTHI